MDCQCCFFCVFKYCCESLILNKVHDSFFLPAFIGVRGFHFAYFIGTGFQILQYDLTLTVCCERTACDKAFIGIFQFFYRKHSTGQCISCLAVPFYDGQVRRSMVHDLDLCQFLRTFFYSHIIHSAIIQKTVCGLDFLDLIMTGVDVSDSHCTIFSCCYRGIRQWCILTETENIESNTFDTFAVYVHLFDHDAGTECIFDSYCTGSAAFCIDFIYLIGREIAFCRSHFFYLVPAFFHIDQFDHAAFICHTHIYLLGILVCDFKMNTFNRLRCFRIDLLDLDSRFLFVFHHNNSFFAPIHFTDLRCIIQDIIESGCDLFDFITAFGQVFNGHFTVTACFYCCFKACGMVYDLKIKARQFFLCMRILFTDGQGTVGLIFKDYFGVYFCIVLYSHTLGVLAHSYGVMRGCGYFCYFIDTFRDACQFDHTVRDLNICTSAEDGFCSTRCCFHSDIDMVIAFRHTTDMEYRILYLFLCVIVQFFNDQTAVTRGNRCIGIIGVFGIGCIRDRIRSVIGHCCGIGALGTEIVDIPLPVTRQSYRITQISRCCFQITADSCAVQGIVKTCCFCKGFGDFHCHIIAHIYFEGFGCVPCTADISLGHQFCITCIYLNGTVFHHGHDVVPKDTELPCIPVDAGVKLIGVYDPVAVNGRFFGTAYGRKLYCHCRRCIGVRNTLVIDLLQCVQYSGVSRSITALDRPFIQRTAYDCCMNSTMGRIVSFVNTVASQFCRCFIGVTCPCHTKDLFLSCANGFQRIDLILTGGMLCCTLPAGVLAVCRIFQNGWIIRYPFRDMDVINDLTVIVQDIIQRSVSCDCDITAVCLQIIIRPRSCGRTSLWHRICAIDLRIVICQ